MFQQEHTGRNILYTEEWQDIQFRDRLILEEFFIQSCSGSEVKVPLFRELQLTEEESSLFGCQGLELDILGINYRQAEQPHKTEMLRSLVSNENPRKAKGTFIGQLIATVPQLMDRMLDPNIVDPISNQRVDFDLIRDIKERIINGKTLIIFTHANNFGSGRCLIGYNREQEIVLSPRTILDEFDSDYDVILDCGCGGEDHIDVEGITPHRSIYINPLQLVFDNGFVGAYPGVNNWSSIAYGYFGALKIDWSNTKEYQSLARMRDKDWSEASKNYKPETFDFLRNDLY